MVLDEETLELIKILDIGEVIVPMAAYTPHGTRAVMHTPLISDKELIVAGADGVIYFFDLDTLEEVRRIVVGSPIFTTPIIDGKRVTTVDLFGRVSSFDIKE